MHVDSPIPGNVYLHVLTVDEDNYATETISGPVYVMVNEDVRTDELTQFLNDEIIGKDMSPTTDALIDIDFVQPWMYTNSTEADITRDLRVIQRAGYSGIILQNIVNVSGGLDSNPIQIQSMWYTTDELDQYITDDTQIYDKLGALVSAANRVGIDLYIGGSDNSEWWDTTRSTNSEWINNNIAFEQALYNDLYTKYHEEPAFKGWYWTPELFSNPDNFEQYWSGYLNGVIDGLNSHDTQYPLILSPFISSWRYTNTDIWQDNWYNFIDNTNLRPGDIIAFQDGLTVAELTVSEVIDRLNIVKEGVARKDGLEFYLNNEIYFSGRQGKVENTEKQIEIARHYASGMLSFSYTHYYNPLRIITGQSAPDPSYDIAYRNYVGIDTSNDQPITAISTPAGGSVYIDDNGREAPLPAGFTVSNVPSERDVATGLVVADGNDNEFVWVPVTDWQTRDRGYTYQNDEYSMVLYGRYLGSQSIISDSDTGTLPPGVSSETNQINKYSGFYVARYESSLEYNNGDPRVAVRPTQDDDPAVDFSWEYVTSNYYDGRLWNSVNPPSAVLKANSMSSQYDYSPAVQTGLITGTQWDTYLKWVHASDPTFAMVYDGRTWGNYTDSTGNAASLNYESGVLRGTGSNTHWQMNNVFDIAGNLAEWTNEVNSSGQYIIRSNGFNNGGLYGSPSYAAASDGYRFPHVGFRVVLYIE